MTAQFGAHEVMEVHEVLNNSINAINQCQLYRPHVRDQQLASMLDHQLQFMISEYNNLVQAINQKGITMGSPYRSTQNTQPTYGLDNPQTQSPNMSPFQLKDSDIASGVLGIHKTGATFKMLASLECADPNLRRMIQQGAVNCAEQAYEIWQYMNQKGYYQVPTMKEMTTNTVVNSYTTTTGGNVNMGQQFGNRTM
ncbi:MAG: hypothetical protein PWQ67_806 [Clostridia bacterium]|jgi:spore coat protein CotF|nr:hypothetical protein [Clostridia bacterium]MDN5322352.1 hypothetical protein [Clostridia bacterium]